MRGGSVALDGVLAREDTPTRLTVDAMSWTRANFVHVAEAK